eukprot:Nk52_evm40s295 gene=Nk52_evmTU40s295
MSPLSSSSTPKDLRLLNDLVSYGGRPSMRLFNKSEVSYEILLEFLHYLNARQRVCEETGRYSEGFLALQRQEKVLNKHGHRLEEWFMGQMGKSDFGNGPREDFVGTNRTGKESRPLGNPSEELRKEIMVISEILRKKLKLFFLKWNHEMELFDTKCGLMVDEMKSEHFKNTLVQLKGQQLKKVAYMDWYSKQEEEEIKFQSKIAELKQQGIRCRNHDLKTLLSAFHKAHERDIQELVSRL